MLYIFRLIITVIYSILVCVFGSIYCLFSPRNPKHVQPPLGICLAVLRRCLA